MEYRIVDEPIPGSLSNLSVNPFFPMLGVMLGGAWLSWPWFVVNSLAIGSAHRLRETVVAGVGFAGAIGLTLLGVILSEKGVVDTENAKYAVTVLIAWKLGVSYLLYATQAPSFQLYQHFGGRARNGLLILIGGLLLEASLLPKLGLFWATVLS